MSGPVVDVVREFCRRRGLPRPAAVYGSDDAGDLQYGALLNEMMDEVTTRKSFRGLTREKVHTTIADPNQGSIYDLTDAGFQQIIPGTFWNRSGNLQIRYGLQPPEWQSLQVVGSVSGPSYSCRLRGDDLYAFPTPPAGQTWAFEYKTTSGVTDGATSDLKAWFTRDDDTCFLPDKILVAYLNFAWKREKGFEHAEAKIMFESLLNEYMASDLAPQIADMGRPREPGLPRAGLIIPEGNWNL